MKTRSRVFHKLREHPHSSPRLRWILRRTGIVKGGGSFSVPEVAGGFPKILESGEKLAFEVLGNLAGASGDPPVDADTAAGRLLIRGGKRMAKLITNLLILLKTVAFLQLD